MGIPKLRAARAALCALVLSAACSAASLAQSSAILPRLEPDATVRGYGVVNIAVPDASLVPLQAIFRLDVVVAGNESRGGFVWTELRANGARNATVVTRRILSTTFPASNHAVIEAEGFLNGKPAKITVEALDDLDMDWIHVHAESSAADTPPYDRAGGVAKGQIIIWHRPVVSDAAKGAGSIKIERPGVTPAVVLPQNIGNFQFSAANTSAGAIGMLSYQEINPMILGPINRPRVVVNVPKIKSLEITGNLAVIQGPGLLNGKPVWVRATARDTHKPIPPGSEMPEGPPDRFSITCTDPNVDSLLPAYHAEGNLFRGDIVVVAGTASGG